MPLRNSIIDGELLIDLDPQTNRVRHKVSYTSNTCSFYQETLRLLAFDCLVVDNQNVMSRTLDKRYGVGELHRLPLGLAKLRSLEITRVVLQALQENDT